MPDRVERAAREVHEAGKELVNETKRLRRFLWLWVALSSIAIVGLLGLSLWFRAEREADDRENDRELTQRLCSAWSNRIEDHATLTVYLAGYAGERGEAFVAGLREAYAKSDARYAKQRGLTEERCA